MRKRTWFDKIVLLRFPPPVTIRPAIARVFIAAMWMLTLIACSSRKPPAAIAPAPGVRQTGVASWYGHPYHGRATASGEIYDMERDTAAHQRFAFGTWVRVDNLDNGKQTDVRINDRGPFRRGRIIDLSRAAARKIDMLGPGTAKVRLTVIAAPAPGTSSDASSSRWAVQVASFGDRSRARSLAARLEGEGRHARLEEFGDWTRVIVPCVKNSEPEAHRLLNELRHSYPDALIFSTENPPR